MNLLVVSSRPPWPPVMADAMTVERTIRYLAGRGHQVDLACFTEDAAQEAELRRGLGESAPEMLDRLRPITEPAIGLAEAELDAPSPGDF